MISKDKINKPDMVSDELAKEMEKLDALYGFIEVFADLHIHIGQSSGKHPIKIAASENLNIANIAEECKNKKGIQIVGIVDCASPHVIEDIEKLLKEVHVLEMPEGGIMYDEKVCIILGSEIETTEKNEHGEIGSAHNLCYFPKLEDIKNFSKEMSKHISDITLSTQRANISAYELIDIVKKHNGILIPAHCFALHKSFYGSCTDRLEKIFKEKYKDVYAIELGLSSDTFLADQISELEDKTFVTNSDAQSLPKIAREYNKMRLKDINFKELVLALKRENGRRIITNYGLEPKLWKYHRTFCENCEENIKGQVPITQCPKCSGKNITMGVLDRIELIKDKEESKSPEHRAEYIHQIPLRFIPNIGHLAMTKLLNMFDTEMNILHNVPQERLEIVAGIRCANDIMDSRNGILKIRRGYGEIYSKLF